MQLRAWSRKVLKSSGNRGEGKSSARAVGWTALLALTMAGCMEPTTPGGGGGGGSVDYRSALYVSGSVVDTTGEPVFGSTVRVTVHPFQTVCNPDVVIDQPFESLTNEVGVYAVNLTFQRDEFDACLTVEAIPPDGSGLEAGIDFAQDVEVREITSGIHEVQFHFQLPRTPGE